MIFKLFIKKMGEGMLLKSTEAFLVCCVNVLNFLPVNLFFSQKI